MRTTRRLPVPGDLLLLWLLYTVFFLLRFLQSSQGCVADEELHSPSIAALLAAGHTLLDLPLMQYTTFCGGCTAETLVVLPLFALVGPALWAWKAVPLLFGLAIVAGAYAVGRQAAGPLAGRLAALAVILAPPFYAANSVVAFGSHFEVTAFVLAALLCWGRLMARGLPRDAFHLGLALGLGFWFAYTSAFAGPVLIGLWVVFRPRDLWSRRGLALLGGTLLGLLPWAVTQAALLTIGSNTNQPLVSVYGLGAGDLLTRSIPLTTRLSIALGPIGWSSFFHPVFGVRHPVPGFLVTLTWVLAWLWTLWCGLEEVRAARRDGLSRPPWALASSSLALAYLFCYLFLAPRQVHNPVPPIAANGLRYLVPLVPLLALCIGLAGARLWQRAGAWAGVSAAGLLIVLGVGASARLGELEPAQWTARGFRLAAVDPGTAAFRLHVSLPPPASSVSLERWVKGQLEALPKARFARRIQLHALGFAVGRRLLEFNPLDPPSILLGWVRGLEPADRRAVTAGVADALNGDGAWIPAAPEQGAGSKLARLLEGIDLETGFEITRELFRLDRGRFVPVVGALARGQAPLRDLAGLDPSSAYPAAVAWATGYAASEQAFVSLEEPATPMLEVVSMADRIDPALRARFLEGVGDFWGSRWGYDRQARAELLHLLMPADRPGVEAAFDAAAAWTFWWPAGG